MLFTPRAPASGVAAFDAYRRDRTLEHGAQPPELLQPRVPSHLQHSD
jgi:hypothetical protein